MKSIFLFYETIQFQSNKLLKVAKGNIMCSHCIVLIFIMLSCIELSNAQLQIVDNKTVQLGGENANIYVGKTGKYGQVKGISFNSTSIYNGLVIENGISESSGIYFDGDYIVMWSPGDGGTNPKGTSGYLVKVYDEDGWQLRWFLDGAGVAYQNSDSSRKEEIESIQNSLEKVKKIRSVRYKFKQEKNKVSNTSSSVIEAHDSLNKIVQSEQTYGFIAQEIENLYPELVRTDESGNKFVNYDGMIPITVRAIQEQQAIIDTLQQQIVNLQSELFLVKQILTDLQKNPKKKN
ncbi:MAG: tail fiber domain-containing protein [Bacteroidales bacterium]